MPLSLFRQLSASMIKLSGETDAGRSIIIDAINAVLGQRTSKELVRTGAQSVKVSALFFDVSQRVLQKLEALDIAAEDDFEAACKRLSSSHTAL